MVETRTNRLISRFNDLATDMSLQLKDDLESIDAILVASEHDSTQWARFQESSPEKYQRVSDLAAQLLTSVIQEEAQAKHAGTDVPAIVGILDEKLLGEENMVYFREGRDLAREKLRELGFTDRQAEELLASVYDPVPEALRALLTELMPPLAIVSPDQAGTFTSTLAQMFKEEGVS